MTTSVGKEERHRNSLGQLGEDYDVFRELERWGMLKDYGAKGLVRNAVEISRAYSGCINGYLLIAFRSNR